MKQTDWLASTAELQREAYSHVADPASAERTSRSVRENVLPLIVEAVELLNNVSWKYWAHDEPFVDRDEVLKEAVDVAHFLANILVAVGVADDEFWSAYREKQALNLERQVRGYHVQHKETA